MKFHFIERGDGIKAPFFLLQDKLLILFFSGLLLMVAVGYMFIFFGGVFVIDKDKLTLDATTTILTEEGDVVGKLYEENRVPVKIEDIPELVLDAYIAIEDRRFYHHQGIDY